VKISIFGTVLFLPTLQGSVCTPHVRWSR